MRSLGRRFTLFQRLMNIRCGPGAAILPPEVSRIHLDFAQALKGGHMGPRKFWREYLPRLKYHNPSVPMIVNRHRNQDQDSVLTVYLRTTENGSTAPIITSATQPESSHLNLSKAPSPGPDERVVKIAGRNRHSSVMLDEFMAATKAIALQPTKEEVAEIERLEAAKRKSEIDSARLRELLAERKKEEDMLKRARAAGGLSDEA